MICPPSATTGHFWWLLAISETVCSAMSSLPQCCMSPGNASKSKDFPIFSPLLRSVCSACVTPCIDPGRRRLRSAASTDYHVPRTRTKLGVRAFSIAGLKAWKNLPQSVRSADSLDSFKRKLKFHLFNSCFSV